MEWCGFKCAQARRGRCSIRERETSKAACLSTTRAGLVVTSSVPHCTDKLQLLRHLFKFAGDAKVSGPVPVGCDSHLQQQHISSSVVECHVAAEPSAAARVLAACT